MNSGVEMYEAIDRYLKGQLNKDETHAFEKRMMEDEALRVRVEQQKELLTSLKFYGDRTALKNVLSDIHTEMEDNTPVIPLKKPTSYRIKKYWPLVAVAASVALVSIIGTLFMTSSIDNKQSAYYKELRRNVDQIKQSQRMMMKDISEVKEKDKPAIPEGRYIGSGFLISSNGYVVTSYHVVKEADSVVIENERFGRLRTTTLFSDAEKDISVLKIEDEVQELLNQPLPYTLNRGEVSLAEDVFTLGYPRKEVVYGEGSVSALTGYKETPIAYQISVPVNPGNSGGPLLNTKGDLVGIISGIQTETTGTAFAIKSTVLLDILDHAQLDTLEAPLTLPRQNTMKNTPRVQQVKRWKDFVFMVRVYKN